MPGIFLEDALGTYWLKNDEKKLGRQNLREIRRLKLTVCKLGALQKARLRKVHFSGNFLGVFDFLRSACSVRIPQENL